MLDTVLKERGIGLFIDVAKGVKWRHRSCWIGKLAPGAKQPKNAPGDHGPRA